MKNLFNKDSYRHNVVQENYKKSVLLLVVVAIAVAVAINILVANLPARYTNFDMTDIELYSISPLTVQLVEELEQDVYIYLAAQYGQEDTIVQELLIRYDDMSSRIHVQQVDPVLQPDFLSKYSSALEANSVIVASGDRFQVVKASEFYVENQYYTGTTGAESYTYESYFAGELEITSAISFVTSDYLPKMYQLTGHGEDALPDYLKTSIALENIEMVEINLATAGAVPQDADILFLYAPQRDLAQQEAELILAYLQAGGKMLIVGGVSEGDCPYFDMIVAYYGISTVDGVVAETNGNYYLEQYPTYVLANVGAHDITQPIISRGYFVLSPMSQGLVPTDTQRDGITTTALLYTTQSALSISAAQQGETSEVLAEGPFTMGVAVEEEVDGGTTRLVWFTSPYLVLDDINALSSGANSDLFLNALSWTYDFDDGISIRTKNLLMDYLTIRQTDGIVMGVVMIGVIPLAVLIAGGIILRRRRKR